MVRRRGDVRKPVPVKVMVFNGLPLMAIESTSGVEYVEFWL